MYPTVKIRAIIIKTTITITVRSHFLMSSIVIPVYLFLFNSFDTVFFTSYVTHTWICVFTFSLSTFLSQSPPLSFYYIFLTFWIAKHPSVILQQIMITLHCSSVSVIHCPDFVLFSCQESAQFCLMFAVCHSIQTQF